MTAKPYLLLLLLLFPESGLVKDPAAKSARLDAVRTRFLCSITSCNEFGSIPYYNGECLAKYNVAYSYRLFAQRAKK